MATFVERIRRHFLWLLLAVYAIAMAAPGPGVALARCRLGDERVGGAGVGLPMLMVAVLLLLAALQTDVAAVRVLVRRPWLVAASLAAVWLGPAMAVGAAVLLSPALSGGVSGLLLGLALVSAMPVANSSVGWTQQSGGNVAWSLGLVVLSILLCPWVTPSLLRLAGLALSSTEAGHVDELVTRFTGLSFILCVLLPTAVGIVGRRLAGGDRVDRGRAWLHAATSATLLLLNYANGALMADAFRAEPPPLVAVVAAVLAALALSLIGVVIAHTLSDLLRLDDATRLALRFGLSMKHTGLALGLAASVLADQPLAILLIVVATPTQHAVAGAMDWWAQRSPRPAG